MSGDFDCDARTDVFWYRPGPGADYVWYGQSSVTAFGETHRGFVVNGSYRPLAGDFNGDGCDDVLWVATSLGPSYLWLGRSDRTFTSIAVLGKYGLSKIALGRTLFVGDFNGNGIDDVFVYSPHGWHTILDGSNDPRTMFTVTQQAPEVWGDYQPIAGAFNGGARSDVYWASLGKGPSSLWVNHVGLRFTSWKIDTLPATSFIGDFNGDNNGDLFAYSTTSFVDGRAFDPYILLGSTTQEFPFADQENVGAVSYPYVPVVGDFNGNGRSDIIWYTRIGKTSPYWIANRVPQN